MSADNQTVGASAVGENRCQGCESFVSVQFRRVFGDVDDVAHACHECVTAEALFEGAAARGGGR